MFEAAVYRFVKAVGEESLHQVPDLDKSNLCKPLAIVVKKNKRWFWQKAKYKPYPFSLEQILTENDHIQLPCSVRKYVTYNKTSCFSASGKIGASLKSIIEADIEGSDTVQLDAKFGVVNKVELASIDDLIQLLKNKHLDLKHEFVKQVREHPRKVLCVITGVAETSQECELHAHMDVDAKEDFDVDKLHLDERTEIKDKTDKKFLLPKGTPLAYNALELWVEADGGLKLIIDSDSRGGWGDIDEVDATLKDEDTATSFKGILGLNLNDRKEFTSKIQGICKDPKMIHPLYVLLKSAVRKCKDSEGKTIELKAVTDKLGTDNDNWKYVLLMTGFELQSDNWSTITYPTAESDMLMSFFCLMEALDELEDEQIIAFAELNSDQSVSLLYLLACILAKKTVKTSDEEVSVLYSEPNTAQVFLQSLGMQQMDGATVVAGSDNTNEIQGAYRAVFALWGS
ncbi:unnamed protein product [Owenia fusiformis]|uniref:Uncharacterized protein n=1 Tax=Owenia fusiformis TaxID=6347 RepID=A0A8J1UWS8_OWEFU|nr:unnamed protein product [Owenia fusiformis]